MKIIEKQKRYDYHLSILININSRTVKQCAGQLVYNTPLVDQRPSHIYTFAEYLHPVVVICLDEHTEWLSCKLSLQQRQL